MDFQLIQKGIEFTRRRRKWLVLATLFGASTYTAYKLYHSPSIATKRRKLLKLFGAFVAVIESVSDCAESIRIVSRDLNEFLRSDCDEIPNSLRQISKIARSEEFGKSLTRVFEALTVGVLTGYRRCEVKGDSGVVDRVMDRVLSNAGTGFVSVVVGSFARNLVLGFYEGGGVGGVGRVDSRGLVKLMNVMCSEEAKTMMADCIQVFVSTAVAVFLDKTMGINAYDEFFAGLTNPKHEGRVRDMLVSVCNGAVETLVRTSHQVLTKKDKSCSCSKSDTNSCSTSDLERDVDQGKEAVDLMERWTLDKIQNSKWVTSVSSTLAVPSNRRFVLHITGRVTFETFRSIVEFFLWKVADGLKQSTNFVHNQVIDRGLQVVRYFSAKSSIIITICLALILHVLCGTRALLPA
ncbi:hypothetical protein Drorol1_Dr00010108 [Drosera rotundifolia]